MKTRRGFVFSIDAFVAFSLSLIALYSLVFFSAIPYTYYSSLMQAHNVAKDSLNTLSILPSPTADHETALGYLVLFANQNTIKEYLDVLVPPEFGYSLEKQEGNNWNSLANTFASKQFYKKLKSVSYGVVLDYEEPPNNENPFGYNTCDGDGKPCILESSYTPGEFKVILVRLTIYA